MSTRARASRQVDELDLRVATLRIEGLEVAVLSFPIASRSAPALTRAERDVARRLLAGEKMATIAKARGTAVRTVANQIASIYKKLGVNSRAELAARGIPA